MKMVIKRIISIAIVLILFYIVLNFFSDITKRKESFARHNGFFEENNYDVLFLGSSHIKDGIFPMELWNDYGITSWNFGGPANRIPTSYWVMINALDYVTPKIMVIDIFNLSSEEKYKTTTKNLHDALDFFPLTQTKIRAIQDLIDDKSMRSEYYFGYTSYHNRWASLDEEDFIKDYRTEKGATIQCDVAIPDEIQYTEKRLDSDTINLLYLKKMIEECQNRNIDVVLVGLPFCPDETRYKEINTAYQISLEYGIPFIDFMELDSIINYNTDLSDSHGHLNASGGRKVTAYMGEWIIKNYDITDKRLDDKYNQWNLDYDKYVDFKLNIMKQQNNLENYLMLLNDDSFSWIIEIENSEILEKENIKNLLISLGIDIGKVKTSGSIVLKDTSKSNIEYFFGMKESFEEKETSLGTLKYISKNKSIRLRLNDNTCWYIDEGAEYNCDIRVAVIDNRTGLDVDNISFISGDEKIKHYK